MGKLHFRMAVMLCLYGGSGYAQSRCATETALQQLQTMNPSAYSRTCNILNRNYLPKSNSATLLSSADITIPVVIHVLYNKDFQNISNDQILSQIQVLNQDFSRSNSDTSNTPADFRKDAGDTHIRFVLAQRDPQGAYTSGIIRRSTANAAFTDDKIKSSQTGGDDPWPTDQYLNIWVGNLQGMLGYAQFPGGDSLTDGVVIAYNAFGNMGSLRSGFDRGRTATHEIGHWLGLKHIWGDNACGNDYVNDTPVQEKENTGCPVFPHTSCSTDPRGDMFMNFMDYSNDECMNMFSINQGLRMKNILQQFRSSFLNSPALLPPSRCNIPSNLQTEFLSGSVKLSWEGQAVQYSVHLVYPGSHSDSLLYTSASALISNPAAGTYTWKVLAECPGKLYSESINSTFTVQKTSSISLTTKGELNIYPNPVSDKIHIKNAGSQKLMIMNVSGQRMSLITASGEDCLVDMSMFTPGVYFICTEDLSFKTKIIRF